MNILNFAKKSQQQKRKKSRKNVIIVKNEKIIIVGGGSAGWMTAATLVKAFPQKDIILIESPNVKTVSVGESTLGHINHWLDFLDIKDEDFMPFTKASYKLSIRFEDFYKKGDGGFHYPFGEILENPLIKYNRAFREKFDDIQAKIKENFHENFENLLQKIQENFQKSI